MAPSCCASIGIASPRIRGEAADPSGLADIIGRRPTAFVAFTPQKPGATDSARLIRNRL